MEFKTRKRKWSVLTALVFLALGTGAACAEGATPAPGAAGFRWYVSPIDGSYQPYGLYVPAGYDQNRSMGVVFYLHAFGGSATLKFSDVRKDWANTNNSLLVNLQGRGNQNWDLLADDDLFRVLADLKATYPVDENRLAVEGISMGGHGCYRWALRYPDLWAASAPTAGWTSYEDFYFKWYCGLSEDSGKWGYNNGNTPPTLGAVKDVDPSRRPALETSSALYQAENGRYVSFWMGSNTGDTINNMQNAQWIKDAFDRFGFGNYVWFQRPGGHCASHSEKDIYAFFTGKTRVANPSNPVYTTNTLRYDRAYWLRIDRLASANAWARLAANVAAPDRIEVEAANVAQFTLLLNSGIVEMSRPLTVLVNGQPCYTGRAPSTLTLSVTPQIVKGVPYVFAQGWKPSPLASPVVCKSHELSGPIGDAFRSRFLVVWGTRGNDEETAKNKADALQFVEDWNAVMIQKDDAWGLPGPQVYVGAVPDTSVTTAQIESSNLRLFGDQNTNCLTAQIKDGLPVALLDNGIRIAGREYRGDTVDYTVICPNPLNPQKYVVVGRGYLAETGFPGAQKGKNLERLPWGEPDYVVWDTRKTPGPTVQNPDGTIFRHLPDSYLEAGSFDQNWQVDTSAPVTRATVEKVSVDKRPATRVTLVASDNLGGFGVDRIEYRLDGGRWTTYQEPVQITAAGKHKLEYRAYDLASRDVSPRNVTKSNVEQVNVLAVVVGK